MSFVNPAEQASELIEINGLATGTTPRRAVVFLWKRKDFRVFLALIKQTIEWDFHCMGQLFKRLNRGNRVAVFYT